MEKPKLDFNTIAKFTGDSRYNITQPLKRFDDYIEKQVAEDLILCPDFQRGHVWTEEQQISFVEFMLKGGTVPPFRFNHPNWMGSFEGDMVCVDGLQRITAIMKFLKNELPVFGGYFRNDIIDVDSVMHPIHLTISVNTLKTEAEVIQWYIELNEGGTPHSKEEIERVKLLKLQKEK